MPPLETSPPWNIGRTKVCRREVGVHSFVLWWRTVTVRMSWSVFLAFVMRFVPSTAHVWHNGTTNIPALFHCCRVCCRIIRAVVWIYSVRERCLAAPFSPSNPLPCRPRSVYSDGQLYCATYVNRREVEVIKKWCVGVWNVYIVSHFNACRIPVCIGSKWV